MVLAARRKQLDDALVHCEVMWDLYTDVSGIDGIGYLFFSDDSMRFQC